MVPFSRSPLAGAGAVSGAVLLLLAVPSPIGLSELTPFPARLFGPAVVVAALIFLVWDRRPQEIRIRYILALLVGAIALGLAPFQWLNAARVIQSELSPAYLADVVYLLALVLVGLTVPVSVVVSHVSDGGDPSASTRSAVRGPRRVARGVGAGAVAALALVAVAVRPVTALIPLPAPPFRFDAESVVVEAGGAPAPVPSTVTGGSWTWRAPEGTFVRAAFPAGHGVLAQLEDSLVMLDGPTGEERWSYRLRSEDASMHGVGVSPDGGTVFLESFSGSPARVAIVSLDALTGEPHFETVRPASWEGATPTVTDDTLVTWTRAAVLGFDARTGLPLWSRDLPSECVLPNQDPHDMPNHTVTTSGAVVGALWCGEVDHLSGARWNESGQDAVVRLWAFDPANGDDLWHYEQDVSAAERSPSVVVRAAWDASLVGFHVGYRYGTDEEEDRYLHLAHRVILDPESGEPLASQSAPECRGAEPGIVVGTAAMAGQHLSLEFEGACRDREEIGYRIDGVNGETELAFDLPEQEGEGWTVPGRHTVEHLLVAEDVLLAFSARYLPLQSERHAIDKVEYAVVPVPRGTGVPGEAVAGEVPVWADGVSLGDRDELAPFVPAPGVIALAIPGTTEIHGLV